jgi:hypothetical protein
MPFATRCWPRSALQDSNTADPYNNSFTPRFLPCKMKVTLNYCVLFLPVPTPFWPEGTINRNCRCSFFRLSAALEVSETDLQERRPRIRRRRKPEARDGKPCIEDSKNIPACRNCNARDRFTPAFLANTARTTRSHGKSSL